MLKPLIEAALAYTGKPNAKVRVCQDGDLRGDSTVIDKDRMLAVIDDNPLYDAYILCVDRDCRHGRPESLQALQDAVMEVHPDKRFVAVCGVEELEVWVLAGIPDLNEPWAEVQAHCHPKENYFDP